MNSPIKLPFLKRTTAAVICLSLATLSPAAEEPAHNHDDKHEHLAPAAVPKPSPKHDHDHDHDHPSTPAKPPAPALKHDHDHDHKPTAPSAKPEEHHDEVKLTPQAIKQNNIVTEPAKKHLLIPTFLAPGKVAFNTEEIAHVGSPVKGRAAELLVRVGAEVKKGDPLLIITSPELGQAQSDYLQKKTAADVLAPQVKIAHDAHDRARKLMQEKQGITLTEVQKREAEFQIAEGNQKAAQSAANTALSNLQLLGMEQPDIDAFLKTGQINPRFTLRAPIAGQVIQREVTLGELVSPEKEALLVIADLSSVWVLADVPEARLHDLAKGASAKVKIASLGEQSIEGSLAHISPSLDAATRTARVRIEIPNVGRQLLPGMFTLVEIESVTTAKIEPTLALPEEAVQIVEGGPAVFILVPDEPNTFEKRPVTVGKPIGGKVPILTGLKEGESVVIKGSFILKAELGKSEAEHHH